MINSTMADHHCNLLLRLTSVVLLLSFSTADDAVVMSKLSTSISPTPSTWKTNNFCLWEGIKCDVSNRVTSIDLHQKSLTGTLPADLNSLSQLQTLALHGNSLSGDLPTLSNLTLLEQVFLDSNNFSSVPPNFLSGLTNLMSFRISDNEGLSPWRLPNDLTQSSGLQSFDASNANIIGSIPDIFDNFPNLQNLRLSYNDLTGTLPATFAVSKIQNLWLNNQKHGLSGTLDVISSMNQLNQVWLQANAFTSAIPDLSKCIHIFDLQLRDNQLTGLVPNSLMSLPKLANLTLHNNMLQGPLPVFQTGGIMFNIAANSFCLPTPGECDPQVRALLEVSGALGYPMTLTVSWKGNNACARWSFITCDSSGENVTTINFAKLNFSGTISPSFGNLTSLKSLSLNDNNLTGSIPPILTSLPNLQLLDVSNNNLSGPIPGFPQKVRFLHENNFLLGQNIPNGSPPRHSKGSRVSAGMIIGIVTSSLVFVGIVSYACYYKCYGIPTKLHNRDHNKMPISENCNLIISFQVLDQVTNHFSDNNVLGRGGFGVVYKGELDDGTMIAVKKMKCDEMGTKGMKEFQAEIEVLTKVWHRHLVSLIGYCINGSDRLLVYEYMPQGTLSQHLSQLREVKIPPLSWKQRVLIALDVGRGVEYLHSLAQQRFIHRDLKSANILLDDDMRAKVADFGLVRIVLDGKHSVKTRLAGTFGYLPPEYAGTGRVTTKVDVYAFGVVLMELVTGRKALDETVSDEIFHLATWFRRVPVSKENLVNLIDKVLEINDEVTFESIFKVAELAGHCTADDPLQRPNMGYVVNVLGSLVEQWEPTQQEEQTCRNSHHTSLPHDLQAGEDTYSMLFNVFQPNSV